MRVRCGGARVAIVLLALAAGTGIAGNAVPRAGAAPAARRGVFAFGAAHFFGSTAGTALSHPIVGVAGTPSGNGYWLVASDGGIFAFGDARFHGSTGAIRLNRPIVGMAATPTGHGYWLVASDGGIFAFGDARFHGSAAATFTAPPVVGMAATATGRGYWLVTSGGWVFARGDAKLRAGPEATPGASIVGIATAGAKRGFWLAAGGSPQTNAKVEAAIAWFDQRMGSNAYEERCETAVELAYGTISRYRTAYDDWRSQPQHGDFANAPRGALVFYDTSADGHVAISLGNGYVASTSVDHRIGIAPIRYFQNPLGWAYEPW